MSSILKVWLLVFTRLATSLHAETCVYNGFLKLFMHVVLLRHGAESVFDAGFYSSAKLALQALYML